jgi:hypothetical protein
MLQKLSESKKYKKISQKFFKPQCIGSSLKFLGNLMLEEVKNLENFPGVYLWANARRSKKS